MEWLIQFVRVCVCVCVSLDRRKCPEGWFTCKYVYECLPNITVNNGVPDCFDKSDEENQSTIWF